MFPKLGDQVTIDISVTGLKFILFKAGKILNFGFWVDLYEYVVSIGIIKCVFFPRGDVPADVFFRFYSKGYYTPEASLMFELQLGGSWILNGLTAKWCGDNDVN